MIEGRILVSPSEITRWIVEALSQSEEFHSSTLNDFIDRHCDVWHFGSKDRELIEREVYQLYYECKKFFKSHN